MKKLLLTAAVLAFASSAACAVDEDVPPTVATPPEVLPPVVPMIAPIPVCPYGKSKTMDFGGTFFGCSSIS